MPIIENVGGVLRTLSTVTTNDGGVIREMDSVVVNDGGVMREIYSASVGAATVEGITPLVVAEDHIVIVDSGTFTLSAPAGARIIIGGGAQAGRGGNLTARGGGKGGNVASYVLDDEIKNAYCTLTVGSSVAFQGELTSTVLQVNGTRYDSGSTRQIIQSKWGPIGGDGGYQGCDGSGAGGGGAAAGDTNYNGKGGNVGGYGNKGSSGERGYHGNDGGSGGYSSGGGEGSLPITAEQGYTFSGAGGEGGAGIVVIEWDN